MKWHYFFFDSVWQFITWVCIGLSVGFLVGYFFKGNGRGIMWSATALGICILLMIGMIADRIWFGESPQFSVVSEVTIFNPVRESVSWFVVYNRGTNIVASPINQMIYVRITNETGASIMIDYLSPEISRDKKTWTPATLIDIPDGRFYWLNPKEGNDALAKSIETIFPKPQLKDAVSDQNIADKATVKGWLCVERPYDGDNLFWRLRIRDTKGAQGIAEIDHMQSTKETFAGAAMTVTGKTADFSGIKFVMYSERSKVPVK